MKKAYFQTLSIALFAFCTWTYMRNSVWHNPDLYPGEVLMIYVRDSSAFFMFLRGSFVALWAWGAYLMWTTHKSVYIWLAVGFYAGFLLFDNLILGTQYLQYKVVNEPWEAAFPISIFRGIPEAFLTVLFNIFAVWMIKKGRERRRQLEEVDYMAIERA